MQKKTKFIVVTLLLICLNVKTGSCNYRKLFDNSLGLSNSLINGICQDSTGFLWIATEDGLNRFDGISFKNYFSHIENHKLCADFITAVHSDKNGHLWVGMINSLQKYSAEKDSFEEIQLFNKTNLHLPPYVSDIAHDENGNIWIATSSYGVLQYSPKTKEINKLENLNNALCSKNVKKLLIDPDGIIWIGTVECGLYSYNRKTLELTHIENTLNYDISAITELNGTIFCTSLLGGIFTYNKDNKQANSFKHFVHSENQQHIAFKAMLVDSKSRIWVGSDGNGLYLLNAETLELSKVKYQNVNFNFAKSKIHSIIEDKSGNIWLGIFQKGIFLLDESEAIFKNYGYNTTNPLLRIGSSCVTALEECNNYIWFGTDGDGLYRIDKKNQKTKHIPLNDIGGSNIISLYKDNDENHLWIGSFFDGLIKYDINNNTARKFNTKDLNIEKITSITKLGNSLLLGTLGNRVCRFNTKTNLFSNSLLASDSANSCIPQYINHIHIDSKNNIWLASYDGLICINPHSEQISLYSKENKLLPSNLVYSIYEDSNNNIWAGTYRGLTNVNSQKTYNVADGLGSNVICSILEDKQNSLWVSTHNGISYLKENCTQFLTFYKPDGIQANEFYKNSSMHTSDGSIYFGGINGVTEVNPNYISYLPELNNVILTRLDVFNNVDYIKKPNYKSIVVADTIEFKEANATFSISFASDAIANQAKIHYKYMLDGLNREWVSPNNNNTATYTNLSHGEYTFRVKAQYKDNESAERTLLVVVHPPWYKTTIANIIWFILAIGAVIIAFLAQKERVLRQEMERSNERKMQFFINVSHEIKTPLSLILDPLNKLINLRRNDNNLRLYKTMLSNAYRILRLSNQILDIRKIEKGQLKLSFQECNIHELITELSASYSTTFITKKINFKIDCLDKNIKVWIDIENFEKVIFNILSNAIKHTPENGEILISIHATNKLHIKIFNSGRHIAESELDKIFNRFYQTKDSNRISGTGIGLDLSRSLIEMHKGKIWAENPSEKEGVCFVIELLLGNAHIDKTNITQEPIALPMYELQEVGIAEKTLPHTNEIEKQNCIVIIDDDKEISTYLKYELQDSFKVVNFLSSEDAINNLESIMPNLVICDIMMPNIDGFTLCSKLKKNINTSHIPIILLSASSSDEHKEKGMAHGADLYVTKPFNSKSLKKAIANILENRKRIYQNAINSSLGNNNNYSALNLESQDEVLIRKVIDYVNDNISNPNLTVEVIAKEIGISRVHLYRKLKEITNLSARDFIRNTRMKYASEILKSEKLSISETAYKLGYSSPSYFSKSFKAHYGISPKSYIRTQKKDSQNEKTNSTPNLG